MRTGTCSIDAALLQRNIRNTCNKHVSIVGQQHPQSVAAVVHQGSATDCRDPQRLIDAPCNRHTTCIHKYNIDSTDPWENNWVEVWAYPACQARPCAGPASGGRRGAALDPLYTNHLGGQQADPAGASQQDGGCTKWLARLALARLA
jgi:hypothetical protein